MTAVMILKSSVGSLRFPLHPAVLSEYASFGIEPPFPADYALHSRIYWLS